MLSAQSFQMKLDSVVYKKDDQKLTFYSDGTYKYVLYPCDICPRLTPGNVWSFGTYQKEEQNYYIFSDESLCSEYWDMIAEESVVDNDSLTFRFHIPHPNNKNDIDNDWMFFQVVLYLQLDSTEWVAKRMSHVENDTDIKAFYTDDVTLTIPKLTRKVWRFDVNVYSVNGQAKCALHLHYKVKDLGTNVFDLDLPMATPEFFIYKRFFNDAVTILDEDAIQFGNHVLLRDGAFPKSYYPEFSPLPKKYWKYVNESFNSLHKYLQNQE